MKLSLLFLCFASFFVDAAKRKLDSGTVSEEPSQKIQCLSQEDAVPIQESGLFILADLVPLFLHFSDHRLAPSLSQVNRACVQAVCISSYEATKPMSCLLMASRALVLEEKIILNFAFQYLIRANDTFPRNEKLNALVKILTGLNRTAISMAVVELLKAMALDQVEMNTLNHMLTIVHRHREENGQPIPYQTMYPKILMEGFESFSEQINNEILRMIKHRDNPNLPAFVKNTEIYHKFFQDMFQMFPEFCAQKFQELLDTEAVFPRAFGSTIDCTDIFTDIMGPDIGISVSALATEPIAVRLKNNDFVHLWKITLNKLTFLPRAIPVQLNAQFDQLDGEIIAELTLIIKLVRGLGTSEPFSLEGLSGIKIVLLTNYISHYLQINPTAVFIRSIAAKVVNAKDIVTSGHLKPVLSLARYESSVFQLMEEKICALPLEECVFEPLKYIGPSMILSFFKYHDFKKLPQSLWARIQSNLHLIALGDKKMASKYDAVLGFMVKSFPGEVCVIASFVISAALKDKVLSEEKNLFFIFDAIPGITVLLRNTYDIIISHKKALTE